MTKVRPISVESSTWEQARRVVGQFTRDVRDTLDAKRAGLSWEDNVSRVYEFVYNNGALPVALETGLISRPMSVVVLSAFADDTKTFFSNPYVEWSWADGVINIIKIGSTSAGVDYTVRLGVWEK